MSFARRNQPLLWGLLAGLAVALAAHAVLDPSRWLRPGLGRVYVIGTCSYSKVAIDALAADPDAPFVALALPADEAAFEAEVCDLALARLRRGGAWWLALVPRGLACERLRGLAVQRFAQETPAAGYPAWVDADGGFAGLGVDPGQIAALGLQPTPAIVRFWIEGGYDPAWVTSLGFAVPADARPDPAAPSNPPMSTAASPPSG